MKLPKHLGLPALTIGLLLSASTALAQTVKFNEVDMDRDGFLNSDELTDALGSDTLLLSLDQNGDELLSRDELRAAAGKGDDDDDDDDDDDKGHGNDADGFDEDNPGNSRGVAGGRDDDEGGNDRGGQGKGNRGGDH